MKTIGKERGGGCKHNIYLASPFLPESFGLLFLFDVFLLLWRALGDGWVDGSSRCYASAPNIAQSFAYFPRLLSQTTAIIQSPTNSLFLCFLCGISIVGGWWFLCIVLPTASLGNWESQTADELSPRELPSRSHLLTNSHVNGTHFLLLLHASTHSILKISHQMPVKLDGAHLCLIKPQLHTCILLPFNNSVYWF